MSGRKWALGGLAGAVALAWGVWSIRAQPSAAGGKPPAIVNGEAIAQADLEAAQRALGPMPLQLPEAQRRLYQGQLLSGLIDLTLMRQFLARNNVPVDGNEVNRKMAEMDAALKKQGKSLADLCREHNQTEEQVRAQVAQHVQWETYARQHVSDAELEQYYMVNKDFFDRTTVRCSHILLLLPATATESERAQARAKLADLRGQILAGKVDFGEAAKVHSQGPTKDKGGDLGFLPRKFVAEEPFARAAFALQVGQVSDVVETDVGLHLIKVTDRKPGPASEYAKIKDVVWQICLQDMAVQVLAQERKTAKIEVNLQ